MCWPMNQRFSLHPNWTIRSSVYAMTSNIRKPNCCASVLHRLTWTGVRGWMWNRVHRPTDVVSSRLKAVWIMIYPNANPGRWLGCATAWVRKCRKRIIAGAVPIRWLINMCLLLPTYVESAWWVVRRWPILIPCSIWHWSCWRLEVTRRLSPVWRILSSTVSTILLKKLRSPDGFVTGLIITRITTGGRISNIIPLIKAVWLPLCNMEPCMRISRSCIR